MYSLRSHMFTPCVSEFDHTVTLYPLVSVVVDCSIQLLSTYFRPSTDMGNFPPFFISSIFWVFLVSFAILMIRIADESCLRFLQKSRRSSLSVGAHLFIVIGQSLTFRFSQVFLISLMIACIAWYRNLWSRMIESRCAPLLV